MVLPVALPASVITQPLPTLADWVAAFDSRPLPLLPHSCDTLALLSQNEDAVDAHLLAQTLALDPLATLKLLRHVAILRQGRGGTDAETVTEALVMLGITPFFRAFASPHASADTLLGAWPVAQAGFAAVLERGQRAARLALGFALHRQDPDAMLIHQAALLHDFAELLLWLHAPALAAVVAAEVRAGTEPAQAQRQLLNVDLGELQQALMDAWRLPALLREICSDAPSERHQVRNVQLAVRLARHSAERWDDPALDADFELLAPLLTLNLAHSRALAEDIDRG